MHFQSVGSQCQALRQWFFWRKTPRLQRMIESVRRSVCNCVCQFGLLRTFGAAETATNGSARVSSARGPAVPGLSRGNCSYSIWGGQTAAWVLDATAELAALERIRHLNDPSRRRFVTRHWRESRRRVSLCFGMYRRLCLIRDFSCTRSM